MVLISVLFVIGYVLIALEHPIKITKSATALFLGNLLWLIWFIISPETAENDLLKTLDDMSPILFFLMGAMTIVAVVDANDGFTLITSRIKTNSVRKLLWIIAWITFFMSAVLDNMTTAIVMVTLTGKLLPRIKTRLFFAAIIVIAANAGGAFSPIGDVTTTMLWIGGQISALGILERVFLSSVVNLLVPLLIVTRILHGTVRPPKEQEEFKKAEVSCWDRNVIFVVGIGGLLMVPVIKSVLHVPPYIAMMFSLGTLWLIAELIRRKDGSEENIHPSISNILKVVDIPSILFFAGILLAVGALGAAGQLNALAQMLDRTVGNISVITLIIGLVSSVVDNVPLVAAAIGMYDLAQFPMDSLLWEFLAYCAGTGGSILIIGSAAGVATMGIEKGISFGWYLRRVAPLALLGYGAGAAVYLLLRLL
ncbi:MAG: sodium:proton antiporter NhaD [Fibrobacter sp.]|jgi:Na+/H+ antiporter NhaD/arsenite permease-like protein|nr:sodium:proton antiporter NhaD [Fibrobacter sp.]